MSKYQGRQGSKKVRQLEHAVDEGARLTPQAATAYRALSARCNCLAQDRADIAFAAKELCRDFSAPTLRSLERLNRLLRYLNRHPRLVYEFPWQASTSMITLNVDTGFAGCRMTSGARVAAQR